MTSSGAEQTPDVPAETAEQPAAVPAPHRRGRLQPSRLRRADAGVGAGTLLYLVSLLLPWFRVDGFDLGSGYRLPGVSVNGLDSGLLVGALLLLLLATAWAVLPAVTDVPGRAPRSVVTAGLAALAALLTTIEWLTSFDTGFTVAGLLAWLCALAVLSCAALGLLVEFGPSARLPGRSAGVVRWAAGTVARSRTPRPAEDGPTGPASSGS